MEPTTKIPFYRRRNFWLTIIIVQAATNLFVLQNFYNPADSIFDYIFTTLGLIGGVIPFYVIGLLFDGLTSQLISSAVFIVILIIVFKHLFSHQSIRIAYPLSFIILSLVGFWMAAVFASGM